MAITEAAKDLIPPHAWHPDCSFLAQGYCHYCCGECEYDQHECPGCGTKLTHDERRKDTGRFHPANCYIYGPNGIE